MAYIGREPTVGNFQVCDAISVVNGQAAYTMQVGGVNVVPETANHMLVSLNGILQAPGSSYTVSGSTITFASNLVTGDVINFIQILGSVLDLGVPSDSTVSLAKLTATGTKDATTFLRGDNTFAAPGGGDMVKLSTSTISANTTAVTFNGLFSSTYKNYFIIGSSIRPDADTSIYMRFRESNSDVTASNYIWTQNTIRLQNSNGAMEEDNNADRSAFFKLASTVSISNNTDSNAAKRAVYFNFHLHDPLNTSYAKYFFGSAHNIYDNGSDTWFYHHHIAGTYSASAAALTGFTIYPSAGNFDAGTITLYGLKH